MKSGMPDKRRFRVKRVIVGIFFVSLLVRIVFVLSYDRYIADTEIYNALALNLTQGLGYTIDGSDPHVIRPPLYSFFLAAIYSVFGQSPMAVRLIQAFIGSITVILVYKLAKTISGQEKIGFISAIIACFYPELAAPAAYLQPETLITFLLTMSVWLVTESVKGLAHNKRRRIIAGFLGGVFLALASLGNTIILTLPVLLLVGLLPVYRKKWVLCWAVVSLGMMVTIAPWTIRNYMVFKAFIPVAAETGSDIWTAGESTCPGTNEGDWNKIREWMVKTQGDTSPMRGILQGIRRAPINYFMLCGKKFVMFWSGIPAPLAGSPGVTTALYVLHYLMLVLFVLGFRAPQIRSSKERWVAIMVIIYFTLIESLLFPVLRYRILIIPLVLVFTGSGIARLFLRKAEQEAEGGQDFFVQGNSIQQG